MPGWRCGWVVAHDRHSLLADANVLEALAKLQMLTLGPCGLVQTAMPVRGMARGLSSRESLRLEVQQSSMHRCQLRRPTNGARTTACAGFRCVLSLGPVVSPRSDALVEDGSGSIACATTCGRAAPLHVDGLAHVCLHPPPPMQAILRSLDDAWMGSVMATLEDSASVVLAGLSGVRGLEITSRPQGALYVMVKVRLDQLPSVTDDVAFATALMAQESVRAQPSRQGAFASTLRPVQHRRVPLRTRGVSGGHPPNARAAGGGDFFLLARHAAQQRDTAHVTSACACTVGSLYTNTNVMVCVVVWSSGGRVAGDALQRPRNVPHLLRRATAHPEGGVHAHRRPVPAPGRRPARHTVRLAPNTHQAGQRAHRRC